MLHTVLRTSDAGRIASARTQRQTQLIFYYIILFISTHCVDSYNIAIAITGALCQLFTLIYMISYKKSITYYAVDIIVALDKSRRLATTSSAMSGDEASMHSTSTMDAVGVSNAGAMCSA